MNGLRQIFTVTELNLKGLPQRFWSSLVIVVGMASVVGVLVSLLSYSAGISQTIMSLADPGRAIVVHTGAMDEYGQAISREAVVAIGNAPGIARDARGEPITSDENVNNVPTTRADNGVVVRLIVRGVGPKILELRPEVHLVKGRMFEPGTHEFIAGRAAQAQFVGLEVGKTISMQDGPWKIVGAFESGGDLLEGQLLGDIETVLNSRNQNGYGSVSVRLESPDGFDEFADFIEANPEFELEAVRQADFYARNSGNFTGFFATLGYFIGTIIAIGALFGTVNVMHSAVAARTREIATLRALGFGATPVAVSVLIEAMLLAVIGALIGAGVAWILFDGNRNSWAGFVVFDLAVTPWLLLVGIGWALAIAFLGGIVPAIRAARLPVVTALRAG